MIGAIVSIEHEAHVDISIEFHDKTTYHDMRFTDQMKYNMGALGRLVSYPSISITIYRIALCRVWPCGRGRKCRVLSSVPEVGNEQRLVVYIVGRRIAHG